MSSGLVFSPAEPATTHSGSAFCYFKVVIKSGKENTQQSFEKITCPNSLLVTDQEVANLEFSLGKKKWIEILKKSS